MVKALDDYIYCSPLLDCTSLDVLRDDKRFDVADPRPSADVSLSDRQGLKKLYDAIRALPLRQRAVVRALYFANLSVTQTARLLRITAAAVVKLRSKAIKRLVAALTPYRDILLA